MILWVDADACPRDAKELIYRVAIKQQVETVLVANTQLRTPRSDNLSVVVVGKGLDKADDYIADRVTERDVVITADIPLAARVVSSGATGIDPRGQIFDEDNVGQRLATRNLFADLREAGMQGGGPPPYKPKDRNRFASTLDRVLRKAMER